MSSFFMQKQKLAVFEIDSPKFSITPDSHNLELSLRNAGIEYTVVAKGYITFTGCIFGSNIPLRIGIHFNRFKVEYIEIFRTPEYYQSPNHDINTSFSELSQILKKEFGQPLVTTAASIGGYPCEQWMASNYIVNHYIMNRFGPEEHLHINFYKKRKTQV